MMTNYMKTFSSKEAAEYLRLSVNTLANLRSQGKGPVYYRPNSGNVVYYLDDLDAWIKGGDNVDDS
jgi:hypothetical protein